MTLTYDMIADLHEQGLSAEQIHAHLSEVVEYIDQTGYTYTTIGRKLSSDIRQNISDTMLRITEKELVLPGAYKKLRGDIRAATFALSTSEGMRLDEPEVQNLIDLLATLGQWPEGQAAAIKSLGRRNITRYEEVGGTLPLPSPEEIGGVIDSHTGRVLNEIKAAAIASAQRAYATEQEDRQRAYNDYLAALGSWDGSGDPPVWQAMAAVVPEVPEVEEESNVDPDSPE